jgi:2-hydroxy-4-carboxymuconate semialdehyde hemiacetal dehydrogenase
VTGLPGLCIVGPGAIGAAHVRAHAAAGLTESCWVVGPTHEAAAAFASEWQFAHATAELDDALADDAVEIVLVTSPNQLHTEQALRALAAGKHVIIEIPVALSYPDALRVAKGASEAGRRAFVCHTQRSFPAVKMLRERVRAGSLNISQITGFHSNPRRQNENWVGGTRDWVDNLLWHGSCHYLDTSLWILGASEFRGVNAQFGRPNPTFGMTMDLCVSFSTPASQVVSHAATYNVSPQGTSHMRIIADEGLFTLERSRLTDNEGNELFPAIEWTDLKGQDDVIAASIRDESPCDFDIDTILPTMELLGRAQESGDVTQV